MTDVTVSFKCSMSEKYVYIKDSFVREDNAFISINERGFMFGDGVFETMRCKNGKILYFEWHKERLDLGLLAIKISYDTNKILSIISKLLKLNDTKDTIVRLSISRGIGSLGYFPMADEATLIIQTKKTTNFSFEPKSLFVSSYSKPSNKILPIQYKLMQGMNQTLAIMEARENSCFEALMLNEKQEICEATSANIFWSKNDILYTPNLKSGILNGITRRRVMNSFSVKESSYNISDILNADLVFLSNVSYELMPVSTINKKKNMIWKSTMSNSTIEEYRKELLANLI